MKIIYRRTFIGPNICRFEPATRFVIEISQDTPQFLSIQHLDQASSLLRQVSDHAQPLSIIKYTNNPANLFGLIAVEILRMNRHPVKWLGSKMLTKNWYEVTFFLPRESILNELEICALTLIQEVLDMQGSGSFQQIYKKHQHALTFTLRHFFVFDRRQAGARLGVPIRWISRSLFMVGEGAAAEILAPGYTTATSNLGHDIAGDKSRTSSILASLGLPVPLQYEAENADSAALAAQRVGYPVVLKPRDGSRGRGVAVNLRSIEEVRSAYAEASTYMTTVVVESYIEGDDYRLLVVGDKCVAAVRRIPATVIADGKHSISELVKQTNQSQRRDGLYLYPIRFDAEVLRTLDSQGLNPDAIPAEATFVRLRGPANQSLGGTTVDVTDLVHPDNCMAAVLAARACLLDFAGVDFVTTDISRSWREGFGGIVEVNAGPGVDLHMAPTEGAARDVSTAALRSRLPATSVGRLPMIMVSGRYDKRAVLRWIAACWPLLGVRLGVCLDDAGYFQGRRLSVGSAHTVLPTLQSHPHINALALEMSPGDLAAQGMPTDRVSVTILTDGDIETRLAQDLCDPLIGNVYTNWH